MYRDGEEVALARALAAHEALEEVGGAEMPAPVAGPSAQDLTALAERLELDLERRRAAIAHPSGPAGPFRARELWPFWSYTLHTSDTPAVVLDTFLTLVQTGPLKGHITGDVVEASRRISYRNAFLPALQLRVEVKSYGASLHVRMQLPWFVAAFVLLWMGLALIGGLTSGVVMLASGQLAGLLSFVFPAFGIALVGGAFAFEARKAHAIVCAALTPVKFDARGRVQGVVQSDAPTKG